MDSPPISRSSMSTTSSTSGSSSDSDTKISYNPRLMSSSSGVDSGVDMSSTEEESDKSSNYTKKLDSIKASITDELIRLEPNSSLENILKLINESPNEVFNDYDAANNWLTKIIDNGVISENQKIQLVETLFTKRLPHTFLNQAAQGLIKDFNNTSQKLIKLILQHKDFSPDQMLARQILKLAKDFPQVEEFFEKTALSKTFLSVACKSLIRENVNNQDQVDSHVASLRLLMSNPNFDPQAIISLPKQHDQPQKSYLEYALYTKGNTSFEAQKLFQLAKLLLAHPNLDLRCPCNELGETALLDLISIKDYTDEQKIELLQAAFTNPSAQMAVWVPDDEKISSTLLTCIGREPYTNTRLQDFILNHPIFKAEKALRILGSCFALPKRELKDVHSLIWREALLGESCETLSLDFLIKNYHNFLSDMVRVYPPESPLGIVFAQLQSSEAEFLQTRCARSPDQAERVHNAIQQSQSCAFLLNWQPPQGSQDTAGHSMSMSVSKEGILAFTNLGGVVNIETGQVYGDQTLDYNLMTGTQFFDISKQKDTFTQDFIKGLIQCNQECLDKLYEMKLMPHQTYDSKKLQDHLNDNKPCSLVIECQGRGLPLVIGKDGLCAIKNPGKVMSFGQNDVIIESDLNYFIIPNNKKGDFTKEVFRALRDSNHKNNAKAIKMLAQYKVKTGEQKTQCEKANLEEFFKSQPLFLKREPQLSGNCAFAHPEQLFADHILFTLIPSFPRAYASGQKSAVDDQALKSTREIPYSQAHELATTLYEAFKIYSQIQALKNFTENNETIVKLLTADSLHIQESEITDTLQKFQIICNQTIEDNTKEKLKDSVTSRINNRNIEFSLKPLKDYLFNLNK